LVNITDVCHVGCVHCGLIGSSRDREIDIADLADWTQQVCEYGIPLIIFTGGEPFERFDLLREGVLTAARHDTPCAVFTSSVWATSIDTAIKTLEGLHGLRHLYLSTDIYHQRRVPQSRVHNVIAAATALGILEITLCITYASEKDRRATREDYARYGESVNFYESRVIPTPYIGSSVQDQDPMRVTSTEHLDRVCWLNTPFVDSNGDLFACHAGAVGAHGDPEHLPYWLGSLKQSSFAAIMETARHRVDYQYLRTHGPQGVFRLLEEFPALVPTVGRAMFTGPCDACYSILSTAEGQRLLTTYAQRPETVHHINARLAFVFGEPPFDPGPAS
jgi:MoaA/NifB/PqqE/SkfB family radical SAM enzyme